LSIIASSTSGACHTFVAVVPLLAAAGRFDRVGTAVRESDIERPGFRA
jgi:hypothetical protein